jgi:hypothetical protein
VLQRESETSFDVSGNMKQGQGSKRTRGRNGGRRSSNRQQLFDSNGPSVRIRGNAFQVHEKYLGLARDAASAGDRVSAENYYQHAEHYFRIYSVDLEERALRQPGSGQQGADQQRRHPGQGNGQGRPGPNGANGEEHMGGPFVPESSIELPEGNGPMEDDDVGEDDDEAPRLQQAHDNRRRKPASND